MTALGDLTWPEVERLAAAGAALAVPIGSTEQHGPHLPLSTDTDLAVALVDRLAARRRDVLVGPALAYGSSGEHAGFAGTISIGQHAVERLLLELGRSAGGTFRHLLFVSAHGGNQEPVTRAAERLRAESRDVLLWEPELAAHTSVPSADAHAGRSETSVQLALDPARVRGGLAEPGNRTPIAELMPALRERGVRAVSPNGVLGDPTGASAAEGADLLDQLEASLAAAVRAWLEPAPR
ncbi:MAG TPA: mycofactocin biosynthesis peptidyl-dipeptidase MftE [Actinomycetota bacterium]|jgi:creatinine amidohydrolase|nr:mycofactocin biosynthesis peptidyl-dipeptidase MftE [Actinomycetota bacterium]